MSVYIHCGIAAFVLTLDSRELREYTHSTNPPKRDELG